ncbi:MAG TPA: hypothetical protein VNA17_10050 [Pyrinomonadaceae bacterium]|nr:hypothetical protein [Pyrinomonadaceae bacterium]
MPNKEISDLMDQLFRQAQMQFGRAVKLRWFYDGEGCPGCGKPIKGMKFKGKNALSLNAFIYRDHGVLIAYMLCGKCARYIFRESEKDPLSQTPLHDEIEKNLKQAFLRHLGH